MRKRNFLSYQFLLPASLVLFVMAFFASDKTIDLHLHDTYYVITLSVLILTSAFMILISWGLYRLTNKLLFSATLSGIHIGQCLLICVATATSFWWVDKIPRRISDISNSSLLRIDPALIMPALILFFFLAGLLLFVINLVMGLILRKKS